ncbi:hypothetical protein HN451_00720, partial [archaeon]|nr:hypothetical protein [archaeon]
LSSYWNFDTNVDDEVNGHDGVLYNAIPEEGVINGAYSFDGFDDYILVDDHPDLNVGTGDFSISVWIKAESGSGEKIIVSKFGNESGPWTRQILDARPGYNLEFIEGNLWFQIRTCTLIGNPCPVYGVKTINTYDDNLWHHVVTVADRDTYSKIYIDGQEVDTICLVPGCISTFNLDNTNYFTIGDAFRISSNHNWGLGFEGIIDEVGLWKRALTEEEVAQLFEKGIDKNVNPLLEKYSPILYMQETENYFPMMIDSFMDYSELKSFDNIFFNDDPTTIDEIKDLEDYEYYMDLTNVDINNPFDFPPTSDFENYPLNIYGRVVEREDGFKALQYFFFYPYNNWYNKHEGDWETIQIIIDNEDTFESASSTIHGFTIDTTYKSDLTWHDETHPIVLVGSGSHASYFENFNPFNYDYDIYLLNLITDYFSLEDVGKNGVPLIYEELDFVENSKQYKIEEISDETDWISYSGRWGQIPDVSDVKKFFGRWGPLGPKYQGYNLLWDRWENPFVFATNPKWHDHIIGFLKSPADLHIYDSLGNHVGKKGSLLEEEIPGLVYITDPISEPESFMIYGEDNYTIDIIATDEGQFSFDLFFYRQDFGGIELTYSNVSILECSSGSISVNLETNFGLFMDFDCDGELDVVIYPDEIITTEDYEYEIPNDFDFDGVVDEEDNCPTTFNPNQIDFDNNNLGDLCDNPKYYKEKALKLLDDIDFNSHLLDNKLKFAQIYIEKSLDKSLWEDIFSPNKKSVFLYEKLSVLNLRFINSKEYFGEIEEAMQLLAKADELIVRKKLIESVDINSKKLKQINKFYDKGNKYFIEGKYNLAILNFMHAWEKLEKIS